MIVKDESHCIERCLRSALPYIDCYAIVDTGSTDHTVDVVRHTLGQLPGRIDSHKWTGNFSVHRNQALKLASTQLRQFDRSRGWLLFLDADEEILSPTLSLQSELSEGLDALAWYAVSDEYRYLKIAGARYKPDLRWHGTIHEHLRGFSSGKLKVLTGARIAYSAQSRRRRDSSYVSTDLTLLGRSLAANPTDFWTLFYMARTFETKGEFATALDLFNQAKQHVDDEEQSFQSDWGRFRCADAVSATRSIALHVAKEMIDSNSPRRAEPFIYLAGIALDNGQTTEARALANAARACRTPIGTTMYDAGANTWKPYWILAISWKSRGNQRRYVRYLADALQFDSIPEPVRALLCADLEDILDKTSSDRR
jgi:glycosyltransferase involved in cell wall biosynthesis